MIMWQELLIIIVGIIVFGYAGYKIVRFFTQKNTSPCKGCTASCSIRNTDRTEADDCTKKTEK
ncbi:MAG: FeoB-associated Cys-rich membrane protein [Tannerella sp.]|jgi:hypothetical protein|nr:FeoB-associated Cys-rich membrane protein [Tannerella sp.]